MKIIFQSISKIGLFISILFINYSNSFAQNKISLDEDWRFHFGNSADPNKDFNYGNVLLFHKSNQKFLKLRLGLKNREFLSGSYFDMINFEL